MSDFGGFNFSDLPRFDLGLANTARQAAEISAVMDDISDYNRKKNEALFETAEASRAQKELLERQLEEVKEQNSLLKENPDVANMQFIELPYRTVDEFDYEDIARSIDTDGADIIWIALGAPKQEIFMSRLKPFLKHGVMIAVGAVFKFYSGTDEKRAPEWMLKSHMEFVYRILCDPRKQLKRCGWIVATLPRLLYAEWRRKKNNKS